MCIFLKLTFYHILRSILDYLGSVCCIGVRTEQQLDNGRIQHIEWHNWFEEGYVYLRNRKKQKTKHEIWVLFLFFFQEVLVENAYMTEMLWSFSNICNMLSNLLL